MKISEEVKANKQAAKAPARKAMIETVKTVLIAVLVTAVVAFVSGMHYQNNVNNDKQTAVKSATQTAMLKK